MSGKYAPPREDGLKPWLAEVTEWGRTREQIVWSETASAARYTAINRALYTTAYVRRATPADMERFDGAA